MFKCNHMLKHSQLLFSLFAYSFLITRRSVWSRSDVKRWLLFLLPAFGYQYQQSTLHSQNMFPPPSTSSYMLYCYEDNFTLMYSMDILTFCRSLQPAKLYNHCSQWALSNTANRKQISNPPPPPPPFFFKLLFCCPELIFPFSISTRPSDDLF